MSDMKLPRAARELIKFFAEEVILSTVDTLHLIAYVKSELGIRSNVTPAPISRDWVEPLLEHEHGIFGPERARVFLEP